MGPTQNDTANAAIRGLGGAVGDGERPEQGCFLGERADWRPDTLLSPPPERVALAPVIWKPSHAPEPPRPDAPATSSGTWR